MTDAQIKVCTQKIKALADVRPIAIDDADSIIRTFHGNLHKDTEDPLLPGLTEAEQKKFEQKQRELAGVGEKRELDEQADAEAEVPREKKTKTTTVA